MYRQQVAFIITVLMVLDGLAVIVSGYGAMHLRRIAGGGVWFMEDYLLVGIILFVMFANNFVMGVMGLYSDKRHHSILPVIKRLTGSVIVVFACLGVALYTLKLFDIPRGFLAGFALLVLAGTVMNRVVLDIILDRIHCNGFSARRILIVGSGERAEKAHEALMEQKSWGHKVIGLINPDNGGVQGLHAVPLLGSMSDFFQVITEQGVDEVVFALNPEFGQDIKAYLDVCEKMGVSYKIIPAMYNPSSTYRLSVEHIQGIPTLTRELNGINATGLLYKRIVDYVFGIAGFCMLCLMYPFVATAIKLDSPGPVFFKQKRVGRNGRIFNIYKFRTMHVDAEERKRELEAGNEMNGFMFKMQNDPRITRVGRFLRRTSLDEFPQFINVIKGEMSLVGTRPPTLDEVRQYEPWHRRRISMKPGITGLWQVSGRNSINDFNQVVKLDLQYIDQWRFLNDLKIIVLTLWVVMKRKGAI